MATLQIARSMIAPFPLQVGADMTKVVVVRMLSSRETFGLGGVMDLVKEHELEPPRGRYFILSKRRVRRCSAAEGTRPAVLHGHLLNTFSRPRDSHEVITTARHSGIGLLSTQLTVCIAKCH